jgi:hypothetical protein
MPICSWFLLHPPPSRPWSRLMISCIDQINASWGSREVRELWCTLGSQPGVLFRWRFDHHHVRRKWAFFQDAGGDLHPKTIIGIWDTSGKSGKTDG